MKNPVLIFLFCAIIFGCAKKNYQLENVTSSKQIKSSVDSTGIKKTDILNKSIVVHEKNADSTIVIGADSLKGSINISAHSGNDSILVSHFENGNLTLDLLANKKTGIVHAIAQSKSQRVHLAVHEKTTINNDVHTVANDRSKVQSAIKTIADSTSKRETKQTTPPSPVGGIKTIFIWILVVLIVCGVGIYFGRKYLKVI